jgi:hypothetical protein
MPSTTIANFDAGRIPDVSDEANFHADATYVFEHMASDIIPGINANLDWMNAALADADTVVDAVATLQGLVADTTYFAKTLLDDPDAATARATLEAQEYSANLTSALAAYTLPTVDGTAGQVPVTDGAGALTFSGYACRAWANFNGTGAVAIRASGNVSSITDNGTGDYTVNFTTPLVDVKFAANVTAQRSSTRNTTGNLSSTPTKTTSSVRVISTNYSATHVDADFIDVSIFR